MKIAFIYRAHNVHILQRAKALHALGNEIYYFGFLPVDGGIEISRFSFINFIYLSPVLKNLSVIDFLRHRRKIIALCDEYAIDVVHIQSPVYFLGLISTKIPYIIENMGSDVIALSKYNFFRKVIFYLCYQRSSAVIQDSFVTKKYGIKAGAASYNNYVIDVGVDLNIFNSSLEIDNAKRMIGVPSDCRIIFSPRRMLVNSNIDVILDSVPKILDTYEDVIFIFAMQPEWDEMEEKFAELISVYGSRIRFLGYLDNEKELPYYYRSASAVLSIPTSDASPLSVYEAMACGAPVIVAKHPWYRGKFSKGVDLIAIEINNESLTLAITELLNSDFAFMIDNALKKVRSRFNQKSQNNRLNQLYKKVVNLREN